MRTLLPLILVIFVGACDASKDADLPDVGSEPNDAAGSEPQDAALPGRLEVSPTSLDYGAIAVPDGHQKRSLVLTNTGEGELTVKDITVGAGFHLRIVEEPFALDPGESHTIDVICSPLEEGPVDATLSLRTREGTITVPLTAVGVRPEAALVDARLDFGVVELDGTAIGSLFIKNTGTVPLTIKWFEFEGLEAPFFKGYPDWSEIEVGEVGEILLSFAPGSSEPGRYEQEVVVSTNAGPLVALLRGRVLASGVIAAVEPAFAFQDEGRRLVIHFLGGRCLRRPTQVKVGQVPLTDVEWLDESRVAGWLPPGSPLGPQDVTITMAFEAVNAMVGERLGAVIITPPKSAGRWLDEAALNGQRIGPEGNPWHLAIDTVPEGVTLAVDAGTVLLGEGELAISGVLTTGADQRSQADSPVTVLDGLSRLAFERGGGGRLWRTSLTGGTEGARRMTIAGEVDLDNVAIHGGAGDGVVVQGTGVASMHQAVLTDLEGAGIRLAGPSRRLEALYVRRAGSPLASDPWWLMTERLEGPNIADCAMNAIELTGEVQFPIDLRRQSYLAFGVREGLTVAAGGRLGLPGSAPLVLEGPVLVEGELSLGEGLTARSTTGAGHLEILGRLTVDGARLEGVTASVSGELVGQGLTSVGAGSAERPALALSGVYTGFDGLTIQDSPGVGLRLSSDGALTGLALSGNAGGLSLEGGTGRLEGQSRDQPAVSGAACSAWDLSALVDEDGQSVTCSE